MSEWKDVAHFMYGRGFWYVDTLGEIRGMTEAQLYWTPGPKALCTLWHVGHIAHREKWHIGVFLQGLDEATVIPPKFEVFGTRWYSPEEVRQSVESVHSVFDWVRDVRERSHEYIATLSGEDFHAVPPKSPDGLSVAHWLFITTAHAALHIGRIQLLRALIEDEYERVC